MAKPLDDRIAAALGTDARAATIADLIAELAVVIAQTRAEHDREDARSKSATVSEADADAAADAASRLARKVVRLDAKAATLAARHEEIVTSDRQRRLAAERAEITAERDQLVADLKERWPVLVEEMVSLIDRVEASDKRCKPIRLESAEAVARDVQGNFVGRAGQVRRIIDLDLPSLDASGHLLRTGNRYWATGT